MFSRAFEFTFVLIISINYHLFAKFDKHIIKQDGIVHGQI